MVKKTQSDRWDWLDLGVMASVAVVLTVGMAVGGWPDHPVVDIASYFLVLPLAFIAAGLVHEGRRHRR